MSKSIAFILVLITGMPLLHAQSDDQIVMGTKHVLHSNILNEERAYWVSLPESYDQETASYKSYPVLIVLDGYAHYKSITGMVNYMSAGFNGNRKIPEMIVVAVQNVNRNRDFTPDKIITRRENDFGGGDNFLAFLEDELIVEVDQKYRTTPFKILYGHSLGGLLATHTYMKEKTVFNAFIAVDPSFGSWDAEKMDEKLAAVTNQSFDRFIYMATANWGKRNIRNRDRHLRLYEALNSKCKGVFPAQLEYFENENHGSVPVIAFHNGISSIFKGYGISYREIESKTQLEQHFQQLSERLSWDFIPPEALVNRLGYRMLNSRNEQIQADALALFILNTENYPGSFNAFDSLADAYEAVEDKEKALINYQKSLELNPNNKNARTRIESLSNKKK
jgi:predicted alpha/beta superfamily hydrolase